MSGSFRDVTTRGKDRALTHRRGACLVPARSRSGLELPRLAAALQRGAGTVLPVVTSSAPYDQPQELLPLALALIALASAVLLYAGGHWLAPSACAAAVAAVWGGWLAARVARWRRPAQLDGLTSLTNRHRFEQAFRQELAAAAGRSR